MLQVLCTFDKPCNYKFWKAPNSPEHLLHNGYKASLHSFYGALKPNFNLYRISLKRKVFKIQLINTTDVTSNNEAITGKGLYNIAFGLYTLKLSRLLNSTPTMSYKNISSIAWLLF